MRLTYLDILEQCFHDKFRGYNKQEVDTFLHLVADDFKSMAEDLKEKDRQIDIKNEEIKEFKQNQDQQELESKNLAEMEGKIQTLQNELTEKDQLIQELQKEKQASSNGNGAFSNLTPEMLKEKAKAIINTAKQHAEQHKVNATKELNSIQEDILKLQQQKQQLMDNIRATAVDHLNKFKADTHSGNAGNSVQD